MNSNSTYSDSQHEQLTVGEAASIDLCCSLCDLNDEELLDAIEEMETTEDGAQAE